MKHVQAVKWGTELIAGMVLTAITWTSCTKGLTEEELASQNLLTNDNSVVTNTLPSNYCKTQSSCLWAGQTINAGTVTVSNDATNLYITVRSTEGFQNVAENIKIWAGNDLATLPVTPSGPNAGIPIPGQFPFKYTATGTEYTVTIPFTSIDSYSGSKITCNSSALYLYVHVDAVANGGAETAWAGNCDATGPTSPGPRWYYSLAYTTACCTTPPPGNCFSQTAFAKGGWVFTTDKKSNPQNLPSLKLTQNRWGWAINLTAQSTTPIIYEIWAGAGLNTTSKGKLVGTLTVLWNGTTVTVTYTMSSGFTLTETHVYAGDFKPTTIAPGQYGNTLGFDPPSSTSTTTYTISDTNNDGIWIIAHAGVYGCY